VAFIIDDSTPSDVTHDPQFGRGLVPRSFSKNPLGSYDTIPALAVDMPVIPRSEWSARIKERKEQKSRIRDLRRTRGPNGGIIPSLDQDGVGYCWFHSGTMGTMLIRAAMGLPYVRLSAFSGACIIKNYRDQGGWGAAGVDFIAKDGVASEEFWPQQSMSRKNDTPACRANMALHKITEGWIDIGVADYDRNLTTDQIATILLTGGVVVGDFNWWGHSVILMDWDEPEPGSFGPLGLNSWSDQWGDQGEFTLQGSKANCDGAVGLRVVTPSAA
jgi:hypothetical protein